jgi:glycosyltransferase involved in cell wall biosynthesis
VKPHKYTDNICNKKIIIIGPHPPPFGGVVAHIKRTKAKLERQNNIVHIFDATKEKQSFFKKLLSYKPDVVIVHEPSLSRKRLLTTTLLKKVFRYKIISVEHNCRILYNYSKFNKKLFQKLIKSVDSIVVIGKNTETCYFDNKAIKINSIISVESPYLPPNFSEEEEILKKHPQHIHDFIHAHSPLITANAFAPSLINGEDMYGFDMCVELIRNLKKTYPNIGLLFGICIMGTKEQQKHLKKIVSTVKSLKLENSFCFFTGTQEFWPLIKKSDLFVRPTLSDTFGLSVQEAIDVGVPCVASDVCIRPKGTILFCKKNQAELLSTVTCVLQKNSHSRTLRSLHSAFILKKYFQ